MNIYRLKAKIITFLLFAALTDSSFRPKCEKNIRLKKKKSLLKEALTESEKQTKMSSCPIRIATRAPINHFTECR